MLPMHEDPLRKLFEKIQEEQQRITSERERLTKALDPTPNHSNRELADKYNRLGDRWFVLDDVLGWINELT